MGAIALTSVGDRSGVSTTSVGLALALGELASERRTPVLIEMDPRGGTLRARLTHSTLADEGVLRVKALGAAVMSRSTNVGEQLGSANLLNGLLLADVDPDPAEARATVDRFGVELVNALTESERWIAVVDLGPLFVGSPSLGLAAAVDSVVMLAKPRPETSARVRHWHEQMCQQGVRPKLVAVGTRPNPHRWGKEVGQQPEEVIYNDPVVSERALRQLNPKLRLTSWWRSILGLAEYLTDGDSPGLSSVKTELPEGSSGGSLAGSDKASVREATSW